MRFFCVASIVLGNLLTVGARADDEYQIGETDRELPEQLTPAVAGEISPKGFRIGGPKHALCEIWLRRSVPMTANFTPSPTVLYPFEVGELIGVIRFPRKAADFRNQEIAAGVYTLRYGQQPEDGNHIGTSETRDFLLLLPAKEDKTPGKVDAETLFKFSRDAAATTHPAILTMLSPPADGDPQAAPALVHDEPHGLWSVVMPAACATGEKKTNRLIQFVVVGHAPE